MTNAHLTPAQKEVLLRPINPRRVAHRDGLSNMEAYDIRAHLTRMFGFGRWDEVAVTSTVMLYEIPTETRAGKPAFKVAYRAERALIIRDQDGNHLCRHEGSAVGESTMPDFKQGDAHDMAIKTAESQALKRAAINLGDQFGLSLYAKGSTGALVGKIVESEAAQMHEPDVVQEADPDTRPLVEEMVLPVFPVEEDAPPPPDETLFVPETGKDDPIQPVLGGPMVTEAQIKKMAVCLGKLTPPRTSREDRLAYINGVLDLNVTSSKELTMAQAKNLINHMENGS